MKYKTLCFSISILAMFFCTSIVDARPPSKLELNFDQESKVLQISLKHPTRNIRDHYIRAIQIYNGEELIETLKFNAQQKASGMDVDFSLEGISDTTIRVKAICKKAGIKEESIYIEKKVEETEKAEDPDMSNSVEISEDNK